MTIRSKLHGSRIRRVRSTPVTETSGDRPNANRTSLSELLDDIKPPSVNPLTNASSGRDRSRSADDIARDKKYPILSKALDRIEQRYGTAFVRKEYARRIGYSKLETRKELPIFGLSDAQIASLWGREQWRHRKIRAETPPEFIARVYGDLLGLGLIQAHFTKLHPKFRQQVDRGLYQQLQNWLQKNKLPEGFDLPARKEITRREAAAALETEDLEGVRQRLLKMRRVARTAGLTGN